MAIRKAIIPAAGRGTRLQPLTRAIPKALLPLGRKPVLQHIVEELQQAGMDDVLIVIRPDQPAIQQHFAEIRGLDFIEQAEPLGLGHAVLLGRAFAGADDCVVALADAPIGGPRASTLVPDLMHAHRMLEAAAVIAVHQIPRADSVHSGMISPAGEITPGAPVRLKDMVEKPEPSATPSAWAAACRYTFSPAIFAALAETNPDPTGEIQLTDAIRRLIRTGQPVYALPLVAGQVRYDTGNFDSYFKAFARYASEAG